MRSNFTVMKDLAQHTKLSPLQRLGSYWEFIERVTGNQSAKQLLDDWGLQLDRDSVKVTSRVLDDERILFGNNKLTSAQMLTSIAKSLRTVFWKRTI
jgi:aubergine